TEPTLDMTSNFATTATAAVAPTPSPSPTPAPSPMPSPTLSTISPSTTSLTTSTTATTVGTTSIANSAPSSVVTDPTLPQVPRDGDSVDLRLQNHSGAAQPSGEVTCAQGFVDADLPANAQLVPLINGQQIAMQMDVKSTYADGAVKYAVLTL